MRIRLLMFLISFFSSSLTLAEKPRFSLIGIYNLSNVSFETEDTASRYNNVDTKQHNGLSLGALFEFPLQGHWGYETGVVYLERGYKTEETDWNGDKTEGSLHWKSIYVPFVGRFRPSKTFTGFLGGYYSHGFGKVTSLSKAAGESETESEISFSEARLRVADYGITYGAGANFNVNNKTDVLLEIRFNEGLANVVDTSKSDAARTKGKVTDLWFVLGFNI